MDLDKLKTWWEEKVEEMKKSLESPTESWYQAVLAGITALGGTLAEKVLNLFPKRESLNDVLVVDGFMHFLLLVLCCFGIVSLGTIVILYGKNPVVMFVVVTISGIAAWVVFKKYFKPVPSNKDQSPQCDGSPKESETTHEKKSK